MSPRLPLLTVVLTVSFLALATWILRIEAQPTQEIAYDDGSPDAYMNQAEGKHLAVKFSLPSGWSSAKLLTVRYHIHSYPTTFRVHVYDSDGVTEIAHLDVTPTTTGWFDVDLSPYSITLTGDFYVTIEYLTSDNPYIDTDTTEPIDLRSYRGTPGSWTLVNDMDIMIRAVVQQPAPVGGVVLQAGSFSSILPYIIALAVLAAVMVSLVTTLKDTKA